MNGKYKAEQKITVKEVRDVLYKEIHWLRQQHRQHIAASGAGHYTPCCVCLYDETEQAGIVRALRCFGAVPRMGRK